MPAFLYQAKSWNHDRRVMAKVELHSGELFPRVGFIVTNLERPAKRVVRFYNQRGTAEPWIKQGKTAVKWTRLSCHDFVTIRCGCTCSCWPAIWAASCSGQCYRKRCVTGH
jgi:hypothetical protein